MVSIERIGRVAVGLVLLSIASGSLPSWRVDAQQLEAVEGTPNSALGIEEPQPSSKSLGDGIQVTDSVVEFPPLTRHAIDYFFDRLRAGGPFTPDPLRTSQKVPNNIVGIWAGVKSSVESRVGVITLRFRPTNEARLARVESTSGLPSLAESFDVQLELQGREFMIRHSLAQDGWARRGLVVKMDSAKAGGVLTEFVIGHRDSGMYFAWPSTSPETVRKAWSLLVCPRTPQFVQKRRSEEPRFELHESPYELHEVNFELTASVMARIPPTDRPERIALEVLATENLPRAGRNRDEVRSLSPNLEVLYRPMTPFGFFRVPPLTGYVQEGILATIETENPAGHRRRQYHSHVVYFHRLQEPSPVPVIVGDKRAIRDEGTCYIIAEQRSVWNEYDRLSDDKGL